MRTIQNWIFKKTLLDPGIKRFDLEKVCFFHLGNTFVFWNRRWETRPWEQGLASWDNGHAHLENGLAPWEPREKFSSFPNFPRFPRCCLGAAFGCAFIT